MMNIYRSVDEIPHDPTTILTVGTFDGVHLGHRKILRRLVSIGKKEKMRSLLITMHPHPQIVLARKDRPPLKLLTTIDERMQLMEDFGIPNALILPFSKEFATTQPRDFIKDLLLNKIGMKKILIGYDHVFGKNREGDIDLLLRMAPMSGFGVERIQALSEDHKIVSSTIIRNLIKEGKVEEASHYLGYEYFATGKVVEGDKRGKTIGFPTANVELPNENKLLPGRGVYFVEVIIDNKKHFGMANIGYRPTFKNEDDLTLEANIFDFDENIYGSDIKVVFKKFIREESKFSDKDQLIAQLTDDRRKCMELRDSELSSDK